MSQPSVTRYAFGRFLIDTREGLLLHGGQPVPLTPKAFETLLVLVENSGHVLGKDELMRRVWPDSFVEENNLSQNISLLRKALQSAGDADGARYIETVPKRGYRFTAPVDRYQEETLVVHERTRTRVVVEEDDERDGPQTPLDPTGHGRAPGSPPETRPVPAGGSVTAATGPEEPATEFETLTAPVPETRYARSG